MLVEILSRTIVLRGLSKHDLGGIVDVVGLLLLNNNCNVLNSKNVVTIEKVLTRYQTRTY